MTGDLAAKEATSPVVTGLHSLNSTKTGAFASTAPNFSQDKVQAPCFGLRICDMTPASCLCIMSPQEGLILNFLFFHSAQCSAHSEYVDELDSLWDLQSLSLLCLGRTYHMPSAVQASKFFLFLSPLFLITTP